MLILALETSADLCSIAIRDLDHDRELAWSAFRHDRRLMERLPASLSGVLASAGGRTLDDVGAIVVGLGPGSFTGVRVAVTMGKMLAWSLGIPIVGVSSLDALAWPLRGVPDAVVGAVAPTRRGIVVATYYATENGHPVALGPPEVIAVGGVVDRARQVAPYVRVVFVCGETAPDVRSATCEQPDIDVLWRYDAPQAADLIRCAQPRLDVGDYDDAATLVPLYVAPPPVGA